MVHGNELNDAWMVHWPGHTQSEIILQCNVFYPFLYKYVGCKLAAHKFLLLSTGHGVVSRFGCFGVLGYLGE
jgi:hypothetical protein